MGAFGGFSRFGGLFVSVGLFYLPGSQHVVAVFFGPGTVDAMTVVDGLSEAPALTPVQTRTFDELLSVGADRPTTPPGLVAELRDLIITGTTDALSRWTEDSLWLSKSKLTTVLRCEGQLAAEAPAARTFSLHPATAAGIVSHRAIQIAHTHPHRPVADYVNASVRASQEESRFADWWRDAGLGPQSDLITSAVGKVTHFLDSWPPLDPRWSPRFEDSFQVRLGRLTLSARADLVLGRPRADGRQTMLICDLKTGSLAEHHNFEAAFYALVATLRNGCAPFRSTVFSLTSGDWSDPDVDGELLRTTAQTVVAGVAQICEVLGNRRAAELSAGRHCAWCPAKLSCPAYAESQAEPGAASAPPVPVAAPVSLAAPPSTSPVVEPLLELSVPSPAEPSDVSALAAPSVPVDSSGTDGNIFELD